MDALWSVADTILLPEEIEGSTVEELFLLCCTFYIHDVGMATGCTAEGVERLRSSAAYKSALDKLVRVNGLRQEQAEILAIRAAARDLHAEIVPALILDPIPGLNRYLIEKTEMRESWGQLIGEIAASHHWSLQQVDERLGGRGAVPTADGGVVDLAFVACLLRISDYAHINRERALRLDRALRSGISAESSLHWDAQANVTGPTRENSQLVYGCTAAVVSIDAWWLFYDMASGLDVEIRTVRDYLEGRKISAGRFTLQGVRGVESPEAFASYIRLNSDIAPIDIRVQPYSMERVIDLLGGPALYRGDALAPIRELIQNCRDAIALRNALETADDQELTPGRIDISLDCTIDPPLLVCHDNGVGMTRSVIKNHLISVASDFWRSVDYARDFSRATAAGFTPIGRFGIGFLSVFMLGNDLEVESERAGSPRVLLHLRGIGRRGELREKAPTGRIGTEVRIKLSPVVAKSLALLPDIVRARAPMLTFPIRVKTVTDEGTKSVVVEPGWWAQVNTSELHSFLSTWNYIALLGYVPTDEEPRAHRIAFPSPPRLRGIGTSLEVNVWPGGKPDNIEEIGRLVDSGSNSTPGVLQCSRGIAIGPRQEKGVFGIAETDDVNFSPDRNTLREDDGAYSLAPQ